MATDAKRLKREDSLTLGDPAESPLQDFLRWCQTVGVTLSGKVYLSKEGTVAERGMLAKDDIEEGETLFCIPRTALLSQDTTRVKDVLREGNGSLESKSGWVPLLLALMWEYTCPESHWRPYLSLWPDFKLLDHPMFWSKDERDSLLQGTGVPEAVDTDLSNIEKEYSSIVLPFMRSHPDLWCPEKHTLELYKSLVAFVMAYSFQEPLDDEEDDECDPNPPMMVPVADMLNHVSNHNANLEYTPDLLKMVSVRHIAAGEEIFNTYGQMANWQLLHMYGFTEPYPNNSNDTADIQMSSIYKAAVQVMCSEEQQQQQHLLLEKWSLLTEMEMVGEKGAFIFGWTGSLTDTELYTTLKILCMPAEAFAEFKENEGWEEVEENEEEKIGLALSNKGIPKLPAAWRQVLHSATCFTLDSYSGSLAVDSALLEKQSAYSLLGSREKNALHVCYGQKMILHQLLEMTRG